jgi:hypothetical protein
MLVTVCPSLRSGQNPFGMSPLFEPVGSMEEGIQTQQAQQSEFKAVKFNRWSQNQLRRAKRDKCEAFLLDYVGVC